MPEISMLELRESDKIWDFKTSLFLDFMINFTMATNKPSNN